MKSKIVIRINLKQLNKLVDLGFLIVDDEYMIDVDLNDNENIENEFSKD